MGKSPKRVALYLRVSTDGQTTENQRIALEAECERRSWEVVEVYSDNGVSGATGRDGRPRLDAMLKDAHRRKFDIVAAWEIDRLGRSLIHLLDTLNELDAAGIALYVQQQGVDTTTPAGRMFFQVTGAFAEFERAIIRERINAGIAKARVKGTKSGKPIGRAPSEKEPEIRDLLGQGMGILKVAFKLGVGTSAVQRVRRLMKAEQMEVEEEAA